MKIKDGKLISDRTGEEVVINNVTIESCDETFNDEPFIILDWDSNIGFGQLTFIQRKDGTIDCESETMSDNKNKLFIKAVLDKFIDELNVIE